MFNYLQPWQYGLVILGYLFLYISFIIFSKEKKLALSLIFLFCGSLVIHWFAISLDPFLNYWDEQYHALVARNCILHPLKPTLYEHPFYPIDYQSWMNNHVWLHKQPLFLWQMALSLKLFGINEIALRIPSLIMTTLCTMLVFRIGQLVSGSKTGLYSAIIFTTLHYVVQLSSGFDATDHNDIAFLFYVTASIWAWVEYQNSGKKKWVWIIAVFAGCAVLNKWLTGLLVYGIWGLTLLFYSKKPFTLKVFYPLFISFLLSLVVFVPWQIYCSVEYPLESLWEKALNTRHFFETIEGHYGDQWFHLKILPTIYNPFVPYLIIPGFIMLVRNNLNSKIVFGLISGVLLIFIFFTIAKTKMTGFTFPVASIMCIALGALFVNLEIELRKISRWLFIPFAIIFFLFVYFNLNIQGIEKLHGINKFSPNKNPVVMRRIQTAAFFKEISKKIDAKEKPVIFNVPWDDSPMLMFYSGATCYTRTPTTNDIVKLKQEGRAIYLLLREPPEPYLADDTTIIKLWLPENHEIKRNKVSLKLYNNKWLCYELSENSKLIANRDQVGEWETFTLIQYADSTYSFLAFTNKYLTVNLHGDQAIYFAAHQVGPWEHFKIEKLPNGKIALKDCDNHYIFLQDNLLLKGGERKFRKEAEMEMLIHSN